jgi:hypothetical protein
MLERTRCDYGQLLLQGGPGDRRRARPFLGAAATTARQLGMAGVATRAGRLLEGEEPCWY